MADSSFKPQPPNFKTYFIEPDRLWPVDDITLGFVGEALQVDLHLVRAVEAHFLFTGFQTGSLTKVI